jgi:hypothetical protein
VTALSGLVTPLGRLPGTTLRFIGIGLHVLSRAMPLAADERGRQAPSETAEAGLLAPAAPSRPMQGHVGEVSSLTCARNESRKLLTSTLSCSMRRVACRSSDSSSDMRLRDVGEDIGVAASLCLVHLDRRHDGAGRLLVGHAVLACRCPRPPTPASWAPAGGLLLVALESAALLLLVRHGSSSRVGAELRAGQCGSRRTPTAARA